MSDDTPSGHDGSEPDDGTDETSDGADAEVPVETEGEEGLPPEEVQESLEKGRKRLEEEADRAVDTFDEGVVDLLSWVLDTETRARIYVYLRQHPDSTSEEIAEGTGLYPSTVREALAELTEEEKVHRRKRESEGAGNNPYEYEAIAPSDLVGSVVTEVQQELNTVFNLDSYLGGEEETAEDSEPINITVEDETDEDGDGEEDENESDEADDEEADDGSEGEDE
ncbi:MAG: winged helix-turn-helix transcriptional regulator [Halobacteriales archaeon]